MGNYENYDFWNSLQGNNQCFVNYYNRLLDIASACFVWDGLPESIDTVFLESTLTKNGFALVFKDEVTEEYLGLPAILQSDFDVYGYPRLRTAYGVNGQYQKTGLTNKDSVLIYDTVNRNIITNVLANYAYRLMNCERTVDVNVMAQKTPILVTCDQKKRLSLKNAFAQFFGNAPVIYGTKGFSKDDFSTLDIKAPFVADKLQEMKAQIWNEALTYLGIPNIVYNKAERITTDEVNRSMGGTFAGRYTRQRTRELATARMNQLFDFECKVEFNGEIDRATRAFIEDDIQSTGIGGEE